MLLDDEHYSLFTHHYSLRIIKKGVKHVLTHRVLYADFYLLEVDERPKLPADYIWIKESELDDYAKPRLIEKLLSSLLPSDN